MLIVYGGSFDPPHLGHLQTARAVQRELEVDDFLWVPCKTPILKEATRATTTARLQMLNLTLADDPVFKIDAREINRETPSYMIDTLRSIRKERGSTLSIGLLMGIDAFLQLPQWHQWQDLLTISHIVVMNRPSIVNTLPHASLTLQVTPEKKALLHTPSGFVYFMNAGEYAISSSQLRRMVQSKQDISPYVVPAVATYITSQGLYQ